VYVIGKDEADDTFSGPEMKIFPFQDVPSAMSDHFHLEREEQDDRGSQDILCQLSSIASMRGVFGRTIPSINLNVLEWQPCRKSVYLDSSATAIRTRLARLPTKYHFTIFLLLGLAKVLELQDVSNMEQVFRFLLLQNGGVDVRNGHATRQGFTQ
jgi:hypothetical protein